MRGGPGAVDVKVSDLTIYNYHGNYVYNWGERDAKVRPYMFGGLGATQYTFGDVLLATPPGSVASAIPGETRFSTNWGGGVKAYFTPAVGRASASAGRRPTSRATPPGSGAIRSTAAGRRSTPSTRTSST